MFQRFLVKVIHQILRPRRLRSVSTTWGLVSTHKLAFLSLDKNNLNLKLAFLSAILKKLLSKSC